MRIYAHIFIFITVLLVSACSQKIETPEQLAEQVLKSLANNDEESFNKLVFTSSDVIDAMKKMISEARASGSRTPEEIEDAEKMLAELQNNDEVKQDLQNDIDKLKASFIKARKKITEHNIDLSNAKITRYKIDYDEDDGLELAKIKAYVESDGKEYRFKIRKAAKLKRGWVIVKKITWYNSN